MKYIVLEGDSGIDAIVDDPVKYLEGFEPIDAIDGQIVVWDEKGNEFHIGGGGNVTKLEPSRKIGIVNVGEWQEGEPKLIRVASNQEQKLKALLVNFLTRERFERSRLLRRRRVVPAAFSKDQASEMALKELIDHTESLLQRT